jgi:F0F1-type ATP synthase membrane subunit b/b'
MPRIRDLLYRFRPAGAPGVAGPAGVPVDRVSDLAAELAPVLASLEPVQQRCAEIVEAAHQEAAQVLAAESGTARAVTARARAGFDAERAAAAAQVRQRWDREAGDLLSAADQEAGRIRRHAADVQPRYVQAVLASVDALVAGAPLARRGRP